MKLQWSAGVSGQSVNDPSLVGQTLEAKSLKGKSIAVGVGSRGLDALPELVAEVIALLKKSGAHPFIIPAMGSHGGATAEGQIEVLKNLGVTEATAGCPLRATMETVIVAKTEKGLPVYFDALAAKADGCLVMNRIKAHTSFSGPWESGLHKMLAIGFGKETAARQLHSRGPTGLREDMPAAAQALLKALAAAGKVVGGIALLENAEHRLCEIAALNPDEWAERESQLLIRAKTFTPRLPVSDLDVLIVDQMGKNISGTGMDTGVIGRMKIIGQPEPESPRVRALAVLGLTPESQGNALGIGLADFTIARAAAQVDFLKTSKNVLTTGNLERGRLPLVCRDEDAVLTEALAYAFRNREPALPRVLRIRDTLTLDRFWVSEAILPELQNRSECLECEEVREFSFEPAG
jgi:hypothetical protein